MTFTAAFRAHGPDVPELASALGISHPDADMLKNWMMDNKPLDHEQKLFVNRWCDRVVAETLRRARQQIGGAR
ncbi:hypothetical protein MUO32_26430 [Shinella sp. CPCC 101442]|uniref:hypothetical protein n=1 Tax=Shinella sp. CPCC 101442 TaxID=2932265 RepID=UPI0021536D8E|nr:hypothetical protein [Shinella sp. CPCC 101442]MCR6502568.1 hypothetical protein [Shinella sp. CPCC 101442]